MIGLNAFSVLFILLTGLMPINELVRNIPSESIKNSRVIFCSIILEFLSSKTCLVIPGKAPEPSGGVNVFHFL